MGDDIVKVRRVPRVAIVPMVYGLRHVPALGLAAHLHGERHTVGREPGSRPRAKRLRVHKQPVEIEQSRLEARVGWSSGGLAVTRTSPCETTVVIPVNICHSAR